MPDNTNGKPGPVQKIGIIGGLIVSFLVAITGLVNSFNPAAKNKADLAENKANLSYKLLKKDIEHVKEVVSQQYEDLESIRMLVLMKSGESKESEPSPLEMELIKGLIDRLDAKETVVSEEKDDSVTKHIERKEHPTAEKAAAPVKEEKKEEKREPVRKKIRKSAKKRAASKVDELFHEELPQDLDKAIQQQAVGYGPQPNVPK